MNNISKILVVFSVLVCSLNTYAVREIADSTMNDIAYVTIIDDEVVIVYNPVYCEHFGQTLCDFFMMHEYGHINLEHLFRDMQTPSAEYEADCWAARNATADQTRAAYKHFMNQGYMGGWSHGSGIRRAERLAFCAGW